MKHVSTNYPGFLTLRPILFMEDQIDSECRTSGGKSAGTAGIFANLNILTYCKMQRDSVFDFLTMEFRSILTFRMGQER